MPLAFLLNLGAATAPAAGTSSTDVSVVGHRVTIANAREEHRVSISLSDPAIGVGANVGGGSGSTLGPFYNEHVVAGAGILSFDVEVAGNPNQDPISVPFTVTGGVDGTHYTIPVASPLIIPAGAVSGELKLDFIAQAKWFLPRDIVITLGLAADTVPLSQQVYTYHLRPSVSAPVVSWVGSGASGLENAGAITGTVSIPATVLDPVTAYLEIQSGSTATPVTDYTTSTLDVVIAAGATTAVFTVTPVNEGTVEANETIIVKITNDARTAQENLWTFSDQIGTAEGPVFNTGTEGGQPADHSYEGTAEVPTGWALEPVGNGNTPDTRLTAYRFVVTDHGEGHCSVAKSLNASSGDELGNTVGGSNQLIPMTTNNVLSAYVKRPAVGFFSKYFALDVFDVLTGTHHRAWFEWQGGTVPVLVTTENL